MGRDMTNQAMNNSSTAQGQSSLYGNRAANNYNVLTPTLNQMATHPQGFSPQTLTNMNTAAMQSAGGGNAATVGEAAQMAGRTNNAGAFDPAMAQAGQDASNNLSNAALGIQNKNAMLQEQQRSEGLSGLQNLYGENTGASQNALGLSNDSLNTAVNSSKNDFWKQWLMNAQNNAAKVASAGQM